MTRRSSTGRSTCCATCRCRSWSVPPRARRRRSCSGCCTQPRPSTPTSRSPSPPVSSPPSPGRPGRRSPRSRSRMPPPSRLGSRHFSSHGSAFSARAIPRCAPPSRTASRSPCSPVRWSSTAGWSCCRSCMSRRSAPRTTASATRSPTRWTSPADRAGPAAGPDPGGAPGPDLDRAPGPRTHRPLRPSAAVPHPPSAGVPHRASTATVRTLPDRNSEPGVALGGCWAPAAWNTSRDRPGVPCR